MGCVKAVSLDLLLSLLLFDPEEEVALLLVGALEGLLLDRRPEEGRPPIVMDLHHLLLLRLDLLLLVHVLTLLQYIIVRFSGLQGS